MSEQQSQSLTPAELRVYRLAKYHGFKMPKQIHANPKFLIPADRNLPKEEVKIIIDCYLLENM